MTEQERAAALADAMFRQFIDERGASNVECVFDTFSFEILIKALRLLAATPAAPSVVTDEMVEAGCTAWANSSGHDYPGDMIKSDIGRAALDAFRKHMRAAIEAALKVKEPTNDH